MIDCPGRHFAFQAVVSRLVLASGSRRKSARGEHRRSAILWRHNRRPWPRPRFAEPYVTAPAIVAAVLADACRQRVARHRTVVPVEAGRLGVAAAAIFEFVTWPVAGGGASLLATDDDEDDHVEQEKRAAHGHRDAQRNVRGGQLHDGQAARLGLPTACGRRRCRPRGGQAPPSGDADATDGGRQGRMSGRRGDGRARGRRTGGGEVWLLYGRLVVDQCPSGAVRLERGLVVVVVEEVEATIQCVGTVDLWDEFEPERHLSTAVVISSRWSGTCSLTVRVGHGLDPSMDWIELWCKNGPMSNSEQSSSDIDIAATN